MYVQKSFRHINKQEDCQKICSETENCTFWSFSAMPDHDEEENHDDQGGHGGHLTRLKRNHLGISQCGIR